jgi:hypothetical protein
VRVKKKELSLKFNFSCGRAIAGRPHYQPRFQDWRPYVVLKSGRLKGVVSRFEFTA